MSQAFLDNLRLPEPDIHLDVGSGTHAVQTAAVMVAYESVLMDQPPDAVVVVGDVNSTMACALAAKKLNLWVAHLEAGLRSFDRSMPEEINRVVTDCVADLLWTPTEEAGENLLREGIPEDRIELVGNIMIDSFEMLRSRIEDAGYGEMRGLCQGDYGVVTIHRPSNVDLFDGLNRIVAALIRISKRVPLVFPIHPRTKKQLASFSLWEKLASQKEIVLTDPLAYVDFMGLLQKSLFVITDSGGLQEETTYMGIPCLTMRSNTERPVTITHGTNRLACPDDLEEHVRSIVLGDWPKGECPKLWDGMTAKRVAKSLKTRFSGRI
jgi:UDP-N-acetylglucosamine 2-epimerase (non-hydrolysing)